jgi:hypothetical protein
LTKDLKDLIPAIHDLFNSEKEHKPSDANLTKLKDGIADAVAKALAKERDKKEGDDGLYMSSIGTPARKLWYQARDKGSRSGRFKPEGLINFLYGSILEEVVLFLCREAGYSVTDEQKKVEVDGVRGKLDAKIEGIPVDIKSASNRAFDKFKNGTIYEQDDFGYLAQVSGYAEAEGTDEAALLAINKENGQLCLLEVNHLEMVDVKPLIKDLKEKVKSEVKPPRCYDDEKDGESGNRKLGKQCTYCPYKFNCWSDVNGGKGLRVFDYSDNPRYLTKVVRVPNVTEITPKG